ncbi:MAG: EAL domain-containing protein [Clostridia bacterium]|nr:EAL domain-containing protein [Clostridia bacterium]
MSFAKLTNKKKNVAPDAQKTLGQELQERMAEFLDRDMFSLVIQPVLDFQTNTVFKGEVLSRLDHPERGVIFPDVFLPVIATLNLYSRFDRYIFQKSCVWLQRSLAAGEKMECISCNFSRKTLSETTIAQDLIRIANNYGVSHDKLAIEITEREKNNDEKQLIENLHVLKEAGFRIILDDYGTGVTSVNDLLNYPLDIVKIDRSLLLNTQTEKGKEEFCALVSMFIERGAEVVCEGIETKEQNDFARSSGCRYGQGFLYFKPIRQDQVFEMIRKSSLLEGEV